MKKILFHELDLSDFKSLVQEVIQDELLKYLNPSEKEVSSEYFNITLASKFLHLSKQTVYQNINTIPHYKYNGRLLFKKSELVEYIENNGQLPSGKS